MCTFSSKAANPSVSMPTEYARMRYPDEGAVRGAATDRAKLNGGVTPTILTGGSGVLNFAPTEKKTLLGA